MTVAPQDGLGPNLIQTGIYKEQIMLMIIFNRVFRVSVTGVTHNPHRTKIGHGLMIKFSYNGTVQLYVKLYTIPMVCAKRKFLHIYILAYEEGNFPQILKMVSKRPMPKCAVKYLPGIKFGEYILVEMTWGVKTDGWETLGDSFYPQKRICFGYLA
jgi:hypothetical protein